MCVTARRQSDITLRQTLPVLQVLHPVEEGSSGREFLERGFDGRALQDTGEVFSDLALSFWVVPKARALLERVDCGDVVFRLFSCLHRASMPKLRGPIVFPLRTVKYDVVSVEAWFTIAMEPRI